jgi:hypothetical protein
MERGEREALLKRLQHDAFRIASHFGLKYRAVAAENPKVRSRYGICFEDGLIKIRLNHAKTGQPLKYSSLIDTLCHELAHLRHFNHGPEFREFFFELLGWARRQGIYRPERRRPGPRPRGDDADERPLRQRPSDLLLTPPRRNGVPIFPSDDVAEISLSLPWEGASREPPAAPDPAPVSKPRPKPPRPKDPKRTRPQQLSLF